MIVCLVEKFHTACLRELFEAFKKVRIEHLALLQENA